MYIEVLPIKQILLDDTDVYIKIFRIVICEHSWYSIYKSLIAYVLAKYTLIGGDIHERKREKENEFRY